MQYTGTKEMQELLWLGGKGGPSVIVQETEVQWFGLVSFIGSTTYQFIIVYLMKFDLFVNIWL